MDSFAVDAPDIDLFFESRVFKILGEPIRLKIIRFLAANGVCDITTVARAFPQDRSVISRHLRLMADCGLLQSRKEGRNTYYALNGFEFLRSFEDAASSVRAVLAKMCPAELEEYDRTGVLPSDCAW